MRRARSPRKDPARFEGWLANPKPTSAAPPALPPPDAAGPRPVGPGPDGLAPGLAWVGSSRALAGERVAPFVPPARGAGGELRAAPQPAFAQAASETPSGAPRALALPKSGPLRGATADPLLTPLCCPAARRRAQTSSPHTGRMRAPSDQARKQRRAKQGAGGGVCPRRLRARGGYAGRWTVWDDSRCSRRARAV